ncbi:hypothetical protein AAHC03_0759 [Spirometra sp. Aus1]
MHVFPRLDLADKKSSSVCIYSSLLLVVAKCDLYALPRGGRFERFETDAAYGPGLEYWSSAAGDQARPEADAKRDYLRCWRMQLQVGIDG